MPSVCLRMMRQRSDISTCRLMGSRYLWKPEERAGASRPGVTCSSEPPCCVLGTRTTILYKSSKILSDLSGISFPLKVKPGASHTLPLRYILGSSRFYFFSFFIYFDWMIWLTCWGGVYAAVRWISCLINQTQAIQLEGRHLYLLKPSCWLRVTVSWKKLTHCVYL